MSIRSRTPDFNKTILKHLTKIQGNGSGQFIIQLRKQTEALSQHTLKNIYQYKNSNKTRKVKQKKHFIIPKKVFGQLRHSNIILSSNDSKIVLESHAGDLVLPDVFYRKPVQQYFTQEKIINHMQLKQTEEASKQFKNIANKICPNVEKRLVYLEKKPRILNKSFERLYKPKIRQMSEQFSFLNKYSSLLKADSPPKNVTRVQRLLNKSIIGQSVNPNMIHENFMAKINAEHY